MPLEDFKQDSDIRLIYILKGSLPLQSGEVVRKMLLLAGQSVVAASQPMVAAVGTVRITRISESIRRTLYWIKRLKDNGVKDCSQASILGNWMDVD